MSPVGRVLAATFIAAWSLLTACGGGSEATVIGVVIEVTGDLTRVDEFTVRLADGTDRVIEPAPAVRFHGDAAVTHLRDHLRSGAPVRITYEVLDDGRWIARGIQDASS